MSFIKYIFKIINIFQNIQYHLLKFAEGKIKREVIELFSKAGVTINGNKPWDIQVKNEDFYRRLANYGSLGLGESYIDNWIEVKDVTELARRFMKHKIYLEQSFLQKIYYYIFFKLLNLQTKDRAYIIGEEHYDLGNDLFESFLDSSMNYSCGYWRNAKNLEEAQLHKMDLIARKLKLEPNMRVLDIGCGWGGLAKFLAEKYNVEVVGVTISKEGAKMAQERCKGLSVDIRVCDYRDVDEKFDRIVSVGMFEHVGEKNYREYFKMVKRCMTDDGLFLLHTIGVNHPDMFLAEQFFNTYIFPNGMLPYYKSITTYSEGMIIEDWTNYSVHYAKTLKSWHQKFIENFNKISYKGEKFKRMWSFYLNVSAGSFLSRKTQVWQVVFSKDGIPGGYEAER